MKKEDQSGVQKTKESNKPLENNPTSANEEPSKPSFTERWKNSKYLFFRGSYVVLHSIWTAVMAVGLFIAWLVAMLAT